MQRCLVTLPLLAGLLSMASPAWADTIGAVQAATNMGASLPTGDDGSYQRRMLDWNASTPATVEPSIAATRPLVLPVARIVRLSSRFGVRSDPLGMGHRIHAGIDIPGALGTPVMAAGTGVVDFVGWAGGYGNLVVIDHGHGLRTRYGHLLRALVSPGDAVGQGSIIGLMGSTGRSTGSHLHYEIRIGDAAVNPLASRYFAPGYSVSSDLSDAAEISAQPVVERWQGWDRSAEDGNLPLSIIR